MPRGTALTPPARTDVEYARDSLTPPVLFAPGTLLPHPRIWWDQTMANLVQAKRLSIPPDPNWVSVKAIADAALNEDIPRLTIINASNASPVEFTCDATETIPFTGDVGQVYLIGGQGAWAAVNNNPAETSWWATQTSPTTFTLYHNVDGLKGPPVDATTFGSFTQSGQQLHFFLATDSLTGYFSYGYQGSGWQDRGRALAICYEQLGVQAYLTKLLELLDYMTELGVAGMIAPVSQDDGRADMCTTFILAVIYDWVYSSLSSARRTAAVTTLNTWNDWTTAHAYSLTDARSNYWQAHNTAVASAAYATYDENPRASQWLAWVNANWTNNFVPMMDDPDPGDNLQSSHGFYGSGGLAVSGFNYGGNDIARHCKYMHMVRTATGVSVPNGLTYQAQWARAALYCLKPDRVHSPTWGFWTATFYGIFSSQMCITLAHGLRGQVESTWMQWMYQHLGTPPQYAETVLDNAPVDEKLLFYDANAASRDYSLDVTPYAFRGGMAATVFYRSDWTDAAVYSYFRVSNTNGGNEGKQAGHLDITRGSDYLLVQSAWWKGTTTGDTGSPQGQSTASRDANTLYFWDGGINCWAQGDNTYDGGQNGFGGYEAPLVEQTSSYTFARNDMAGNYSVSAKTARTLLYFFRDYLAVGDGVFIVADRIKATSSAFTKRLHWHFAALNMPVLSGDTVSSVVNSSKLYVKTLSPAAASIALVRNVISGMNANWHATVEPATASVQFDPFTVCYATTAAGSLPTITALSVIDGNFRGAQIETATPKVVVLPALVQDNGSNNFASALQTACSFQTTHGGTANYVVQGLAAGTYYVRRGVTLVATLTIVADGVLAFASTAGAFSITTS